MKQSHPYGTRSSTAAARQNIAFPPTPDQTTTLENLPPQRLGAAGGHLTISPYRGRTIMFEDELTEVELDFINNGPVVNGPSLTIGSASSSQDSYDSLELSSSSSQGSVSVSSSSASSSAVSVSHSSQLYTGRPIEQLLGLPLRYLTREELDMLTEEQIFAQVERDGTPTSSMYASDEEDEKEDYGANNLGGEFEELTAEPAAPVQRSALQEALDQRQAEYDAYHQLHINDGLRDALESCYHIDYLREKYPNLYKNDDRTEAQIEEMKSFYPDIYANDDKKLSADDDTESVSSSAGSSGRPSSVELSSGYTSQEEEDDLIASLIRDLEKEEIDSDDEEVQHQHKRAKLSDDEESSEELYSQGSSATPQSPISHNDGDLHHITNINTPAGFYSGATVAGQTPSFATLFASPRIEEGDTSGDNSEEERDVLNEGFILEEGEKLPLDKDGNEMDLSGEDALFTPEELAEGSF